MREMFKSAVHIIISNKDKILVQKRKGTKLWPSYYALPAGHIEEGENQYDTLIREAKEELNILINPKDIINSYIVLRRNYFEIDGKKLEPYIDFYFEISKYQGVPLIAEPDKCDELIWVDINNLPSPFINYEGDFLTNRNITTYDCYEALAYVKNNSRRKADII